MQPAGSVYPKSRSKMFTKIISRYLDNIEAEALRAKLEAEGIACEVKKNGLPRFLGGFINYQVQIDHTDTQRAQLVVDAFNEAAAIERAALEKSLTEQCPKCRSTAIFTLEKRSVLAKIRYYGVTVWNCKECETEWYT
jgi:formate dehydrogenase maturation protein FdhE